MTPPVWFLAHPVAPCDGFTFERNMRHVVGIVRTCFRNGVHVVAPYVATCLALEDENPEERAMGMAANDAVIRGLGRLLMVGHKRTAGMQHELEVVTALEDHAVWDCVGIPDRNLAQWLGLNGVLK